MKILIDNGHGQETAGKRSPDGRLLEWSYNREIARRVVAALQILPGHRMRFDYSDGDPDQEANFSILHKTACAACLTENGFMDCKESLEFLLTEEGKQAIVDLHVQGIKEYVKLCSTD